MGWGETYDVAFSSNGFSAEQAGSKGTIFGVWAIFLLLFHDGTVVVDKNKSVLKLGVVLAISPRI